MVLLVTEITELLLRPPVPRMIGPPDALTDDVLITMDPPLKGPPMLIAVPVVDTRVLRSEIELVVVPIKRIALADVDDPPGPLVRDVLPPVMVTDKDDVVPMTRRLFVAAIIFAEPPTQMVEGVAPYAPMTMLPDTVALKEALVWETVVPTPETTNDAP